MRVLWKQSVFMPSGTVLPSCWLNSRQRSQKQGSAVAPPGARSQCWQAPLPSLQSQTASGSPARLARAAAPVAAWVRNVRRGTATR